MSIKNKTPGGPAPMLKNAAAAPFVYFDNAPVLGVFSGNIEIELSARMLTPKADGEVAGEMSCVAHLRCSPQAALLLIDALQRAVGMHNKQLEKPSDLLSN